MRQGQALLDAVQRLQGGKTGEGLARALCETALDMSGARGAALVRWSADEDAGEVSYATDAIGIKAPAPLEGTSLVAEACRAGKLQVVEDAHAGTLGRALFGMPRDVAEPGALAIVPLVKDGR